MVSMNPLPRIDQKIQLPPTVPELTFPPGIVRPPEDRPGIEELSDFEMEVFGIRLDPTLTKEEKIKKLEEMKDTVKKECEAGTIEDVVRDIRNDEIDFIIDMIKEPHKYE